MTDTKELRALIEKATPGTCVVVERGVAQFGYDVDPFQSGMRGQFDRIEDATFVAAAVNALPALLAENKALRGLLEITPEVARCVRLMGMRHAGPVLVRPVEFSHDRAPLLEYFARIDAALGDA